MEKGGTVQNMRKMCEGPLHWGRDGEHGLGVPAPPRFSTAAPRPADPASAAVGEACDSEVNPAVLLARDGPGKRQSFWCWRGRKAFHVCMMDIMHMSVMQLDSIITLCTCLLFIGQNCNIAH